MLTKNIQLCMLAFPIPRKKIPIKKTLPAIQTFIINVRSNLNLKSYRLQWHSVSLGIT